MKKRQRKKNIRWKSFNDYRKEIKRDCQKKFKTKKLGSVTEMMVDIMAQSLSDKAEWCKQKQKEWDIS